MKTVIVGYRVSDLDRSLAFYARLGYVEIGRVGVDDGTRLAVLKLPDEPIASLELVHRPGDGPAQPGGFDHLAIAVDDLEATVTSLLAAGLRPGPIERPGGPEGPRVSWISDPDGYRIELVAWPPGHPGGLTAADFS